MASSIVTSTAKQLGGLVVSEAKYLYEVSEKIENLQEDLRWMLCFLEDADNRQNREKVVAEWISTIREFTYEAEEIIETYLHKVSNPRQNGGLDTIVKWWLCALCDARALHEVGSNIDGLTKRIEKLVSRLQLYGVKVTKKDATTRNTIVRQTYSHVEEDPIGLEGHTTKVVEQLVTKEEVKVVGIWGMGGLGKTTLARKVIQDKSVRKLFNEGRIAWVCISKQFETRKVFMEILTSLADEQRRGEISTLPEAKLPGEICEVLSRHECVVVLDDLWEFHDWDALKPAFESIKHSGSKILITTRSKRLIEHIDSLGYSHNPNLLSDDESWKLLQRTAFAQRKNPDGDMEAKEELGKEMLRHCEGLPLAILTLGGVLSNKKTLSEWENVHKNIKSYLMGDSRQTTSSNNEGPFAILELSYNDIPYYLKPCFMYLGHFPEDYEISVDRLYHLWEAEGLVTNSEDDDGAEDLCLDDIAESYLNELADRCLVQVGKRCKVNGRIRTCRLHDVVRLMCLKKCKEVNFLKTIRTKDSSSRKRIASCSSTNMKMHRCALYMDSIGEGSLSEFESRANIAPCTRSLLAFDQDKGCYWGGVFFSGYMKKSLLLLRILDLEGAFISRHGVSMKDLIHLRYLSFNRATIIPTSKPRLFETFDWVNLPYFWDCKYLETLDLRCRDCTKLRNKLWRLPRLRHLYLPKWFELKGRKKTVALTQNQLEQLETLLNVNAEYFDMESLRKMTSMRAFTFEVDKTLTREDVGHFVKLPMIATRRQPPYPMSLELEGDVMNGDDPSLLTTLGSHACITKLKIFQKIEDASRLERFDKRYLTILQLSMTELGQQGISVIEKLPLLTRLYLFEGSYVDKKMSFCSGGFPQLNLLKMVCIGVEEWEISEGAVLNLEKLDMWNCSTLKMLPSGLPTTVRVECHNPCISGIEKFNTCPDYRARDKEEEEE